MAFQASGARNAHCIQSGWHVREGRARIEWAMRALLVVEALGVELQEFAELDFSVLVAFIHRFLHKGALNIS